MAKDDIMRYLLMASKIGLTNEDEMREFSKIMSSGETASTAMRIVIEKRFEKMKGKSNGKKGRGI